MSADAHAGGHAGHGGHDEGWTQNQKSVGLAVFVIVALVATVYGFVRQGEKKHPSVPHDHGQARAEVVDATPKTELPRRVREPKAFPPGSAGGRMRFAAGLERRFQRRGRDLTIQATGTDSAVFQLSYSANAVDQKHIEELKRSEGLHRELRGRGFTRLVLRVGDRQVYSKDL